MKKHMENVYSDIFKSKYPWKYMSKKYKNTTITFYLIIAFMILLSFIVSKIYIDANLKFIFGCTLFLLNNLFFVAIAYTVDELPFYDTIYESKFSSISRKNIKLFSKLSLVFIPLYILIFLLISNVLSLKVFFELFMALEMIFLAIWGTYFQSIVIFLNESYYSGGNVILYKLIKKIDFLKTRDTLIGTFKKCKITLYNGDVIFEQFFEEEYNFLLKIIKEKENAE